MDHEAAQISITVLKIGLTEMKKGGYHAIWFHANQSTYPEFGIIARYNHLSTGSNSAYSEDKTKNKISSAPAITLIVDSHSSCTPHLG